MSVTVTAAFSAATSGSGTLSFNLGFNTGDITPSISPPDNASSDTPLIYLSIFNPGAPIVFGTQTPNITLTDSNGYSKSATTCEFDIYSNNGGSGPAWHEVDSGTISGNTVTFPPVSTGGSVQIQTGQSIGAFACN
jgi:hypothetical protein